MSQISVTALTELLQESERRQETLHKLEITIKKQLIMEEQQVRKIWLEISTEILSGRGSIH